MADVFIVLAPSPARCNQFFYRLEDDGALTTHVCETDGGRVCAALSARLCKLTGAPRVWLLAAPRRAQLAYSRLLHAFIAVQIATYGREHVHLIEGATLPPSGAQVDLVLYDNGPEDAVGEDALGRCDHVAHHNEDGKRALHAHVHVLKGAHNWLTEHFLRTTGLCAPLRFAVNGSADSNPLLDRLASWYTHHRPTGYQLYVPIDMDKKHRKERREHGDQIKKKMYTGVLRFLFSEPVHET